MKPRTRVLVALTALPYDPADLERAAQLASALEADLYGLFVEDLELLALAALPGAVEISYPRAEERRLDVSSLEQTYRREAERARARLVECSTRVHVRCGFEVVRERRIPAAISRARNPDLVFMLSNSRARGRSDDGPVVAVCDSSPAGRRALRAAGRVAQRSHVPVLAVLVDGQSRTERESTMRELQAEAPSARFEPVQARDWPDWAALARRRRAALVMIGLDRPGTLPADLDNLVRQAGCPTVVVG